MPLYEFECQDCGFEFEELSNKNMADTLKCKRCGGDTKRKMSSFSSVITGGSPNESADMAIGRAANKRWEMHHERQNKRRKGQVFENVEVPKIGNKYAPAMALGSKEERTKRKEYSVALQEHRRKREKRGQKQFSESGSF